MFSIGDMVVYGIHGVCRIADIECRSVDQKAIEYYVLEPVNPPVAKFYVPTQNPVAVAKMRKVLTKEDLIALLESHQIRENNWIADENARKDAYRQLITRADCAELIPMIRALYIHKQEQLAAGKKFHLCDENFLKDAQRLICAEVSQVLGIAPEEVGPYIQSKIETE